MVTVYLSGYSDDLVELDGDISEEYDHLPDTPGVPFRVRFADGTIAVWTYDAAGRWRITRDISHEGTGTWEPLHEASDEDDGSEWETVITYGPPNRVVERRFTVPGYSDCVRLTFDAPTDLPFHEVLT